ncbi:putative nucleoside-diphosphate-sugar protein [Neofusicoccum parvum UCRNP2]|uniref:Putative nucleoside-diphosphate-sugar protein n=1 Tax=Botryosphaeria parva (strain UCR-NP2) TaxID=1287680 RepID=R1FVM8_BOTPV|nr:putative nucleoside-diphosphate-sugar protein [Neofusicoccum parvum UCRNP2]
MKVILTGATGFVGSHVLHALLADPTITTVFALTRAPLSASSYLTPAHLSSSKLVEIAHDDFLSYPPALLDRLRGASACLWCIGGRHTQRSRWATDEEYVRVSVAFTTKAAEAFRTALAAEQTFRFVFCSGHATELDESRSLWVMGRTRKVKGMAEKALFELARGHAADSPFEAYAVRPCGIYQKDPSLKDRLMTAVVLPSCRAEELAAVMVEVAKVGSQKQIVVHERIRAWGGELIKKAEK